MDAKKERRKGRDIIYSLRFFVSLQCSVLLGSSLSSFESFIPYPPWHDIVNWANRYSITLQCYPVMQILIMAPIKALYCLRFVCVFLILSLSTTAFLHGRISDDSLLWRRQSTESAGSESEPPLVTFQVAEPVTIPSKESTEGDCFETIVLMEHVFAFSYGHPFIGTLSIDQPIYFLLLPTLIPFPGTYTPPRCDFNRVTINLTVTSQGTQYDRLGFLYLGDIEVFRTSTAEPTRAGIVWTYVKEMYHYLPLWKKDQKIIFDLGNLVNEKYNGKFKTTLTATFFRETDSPEIADVILPISAKRAAVGQGSAFSVPSEPAIIVHEFPLNIEKAVVSLAACGQDREEFWYTNVLSSRTETFDSGDDALNGFSAFREVQLLIDGQLAGVSWPFPIIFTGGIAPGLWRPIVGIDAFDLREHEIDITPFVPLLCDGYPHVFQIQVVGLREDGEDHAVLSDQVGKSWVVSGKIFLFLNDDGHHTTGFAATHETSPPYIQISSRATTNSQGANESLTVNTDVHRHVYISSLIATPRGFRESWWRQELSFYNLNKWTRGGVAQLTSQRTTGFDQSKSDYQTRYRYPLTIRSTFSTDENQIQIEAALSRSQYFTEVGPSVFPSGYRAANRSSSIGRPKLSGGVHSTTQVGHAKFFAAEKGSYNFGSTMQDLVYKGIKADNAGDLEEIYHRHVQAVNSTVREDLETFLGGGGAIVEQRLRGVEETEPSSLVEKDVSIRAMLGRGPGKTKAEVERKGT